MASMIVMASINGVAVAGEEIPEIVVSLSVPLSKETVPLLSFLGAAKHHGTVRVEIMSAQTVMDFPAAAEPAQDGAKEPAKEPALAK